METEQIAIVIDSEEDEPQPKKQKQKQKQERSPLVVINNEGNIKKKQLTLKEMVSSSNKTKQINLKSMLTSPKTSKTTTNSTSNSPRVAKTPATTPVTTPATTPRGVKRKSTFSDEDKTAKTPVKQQAKESAGAVIIEEKLTSKPEIELVYDSDETRETHTEFTTPTKEAKDAGSTVIDSATIETKETLVSKDTDKGVKRKAKPKPNKESTKKSATKKGADKESATKKAAGKESSTKKGADKESTTKKGADKESAKTHSNHGNKTPSGKEPAGKGPVKKKFGEAKKKEVPKSSDDTKKAGTPKITQFTSKAVPRQDVKPKEPVTPKSTKANSDTPKTPAVTPTPVTAVTPMHVTAVTPTHGEGGAKENTEPEKMLVIQVDGEKAGPSGLNKTPVAEKKKINRMLTPKQKRLQEEREKKRKEKEEAKEIERKAKEAAREAEKKVREEAREAEKKVREEAREAEKKAREEAREAEKKTKEAARDAEKQKREEDKKKKEAERIKKESEKEEKESDRKRKIQEKEDEKKRDTEEQEAKRLKKLREQEKFKSFFRVKKPSTVSPPANTAVTTLEKKFRDFLITPNMWVAPIARTGTLDTNTDILDASVSWTDKRAHIVRLVSEMKSKERPRSEELSLDLEIISISGGDKKVRAKRKILLFHENYRPAYCGSWRKKSALIKPRKPFEQDKNFFDYDYDSDEDWEEEEEGEDITSEKEDEKEEEEKAKKEEDDEDDGFFVPHGYLSDDEGDEDGELSEEAKKKRVEQRRKQFDEEQKSKQSGILKAKIVGPAWQGEAEGREDDAVELLGKCAAVWLCDTTDDAMIDPFAREQPVAQMEVVNDNNFSKKELPIEGYKMLIEFLHGNPTGLSRAVERFQEHWHSDESRNKVSKRQLEHLIKSLMKKNMRPGNFGKLCWYASDETLSKHGLERLIGLHCERPDPQVLAPATLQTPAATPAQPPANTLRKFTKTITTEEAMLEQSKLIAQLKLQQQVIALQHLQNQQLVQQQQLQKPGTATTTPGNQGNTRATPSIASFLKPTGSITTTPATQPQVNNSKQQNTAAKNPTIPPLIPAATQPVSSVRTGKISSLLKPAAQQPVKRRLLLTPVGAGGAANPVGAAATSGAGDGPPRRLNLVPVTLKPTSNGAGPIMIDDDSQETSVTTECVTMATAPATTKPDDLHGNSDAPAAQDNATVTTSTSGS